MKYQKRQAPSTKRIEVPIPAPVRRIQPQPKLSLPGARKALMGTPATVPLAQQVAPDAPVLTFTAGQEEITLSVLAVSGASTYDFQLATDAGFTANLQTVTQSELTTTFGDLNPATTYHGRARAKNQYGDSAYDSDSGTPNSLAAPSFVGFTQVTDTTLTGTWSSNSPNAVSYTVEVGTATGLSDQAVLSDLQAPIVAAMQGLTPASDYFFRARAVGVANGTADSERSTFTTAAQSSAITIGITRSATAGVAPLGVFFDAKATTSTHTTDHFRSLDFEWDFGDTGAGNWGYGNQVSTTVRSRNKAIGPVAAHVFETAGEYTVQLTVRAVNPADDSIVTKTTTVAISVTDPDTVYAGTATVCISQTGNFTGAPSGSEQLTLTTYSQVDAEIEESANRRILLRAGESWSSTNTTRLPAGVLVGRYGTGANPIITGTSTSATPFVLENDDVRMVDITVLGTSTPPTYAQTGAHSLIVGTSDTAGAVLLRVVAKNAKGTGFDAPTSGQTGGVRASKVFFHDGELGECRDNCFFGAIQNFSMQGNLLHDARFQHIVRMEHELGLILSHNTVRNAAAAKDYFAIRENWAGGEGNSWPATTYGEYFIVADNIIEVTPVSGTTPDFVMQIGPQDASTEGRQRNYIVERNFVYGAPSGSTASAAIFCGGDDSIVRSNVFDLSNFSFDFGVRLNNRGPEPEPDNTYIVNNTFYKGTDDDGTPEAIFNDGTNNHFVGNLVYFTSGGTIFTESGTGSTAANNTSTATTNPSFGGTPGTSDPTAYQPTGSSYASNQGGDLADTFSWRDFAGTLRPSTSTDMGAWEI